MTPFLAGLALQASIIFALGAQNIYVLESGLRRNKQGLVALTCTLCDFALIMIGVMGAGTIFVNVPTLKVIFGAMGVAFLAFYGLQKVFSRAEALDLSGSPKASPKKVVMQALAFSLLNPHVYLDTVVLIGGFSAKYETLSQRAQFGFGATAFSAIWFFSLAYASSYLRKFLSNPKQIQWVMRGAGMVLLVLALKLGSDVIDWMKF